MAYFEPFFMGVSDNLQDEITGEKVDMSFATEDEEKLPVRECIELKGITYAYPNTDKLIFDHADMTIPIGSSVGIVGTSGAGKSTIVDILLGLLEIREGSICADGADVRMNYRRWLKNIGYIPQMIFMLDDTIRKNVAFGVPEDKIDEERLWEVLKESQLDEFVRSLPEGADTGSASGAFVFLVVRDRGSALPGLCITIRRCWCWMRLPLRWITIRRRRLWKPSTDFMAGKH